MLASPLITIASQSADTLASSDRAIRDTIAAVFRSGEFHRASMLERFLTWLTEKLTALFNALPSGASHTFTRVLGVIALVALVAFIGRVVYAFTIERRSIDGDGGRHGLAAAGAAHDPLATAHAAAARGDYTAAAHALYAALLLAISRRERVRLHPSKTVGDYVRELRARSSAIFGGFREFARSYEVVIYGLGSCDRERYERLYGLAAGIVQPARGPLG